MATYLQRRGREVRQQQLDFLATQRQQAVKVRVFVRCDHLKDTLWFQKFESADQLLITSLPARH